jgi:hypothetical protein
MPTKLQKPIRREVDIDGEPYTVTIAPDGLKLTRKGFRKGSEVSWRSLVSREGGGGGGGGGDIGASAGASAGGGAAASGGGL